MQEPIWQLGAKNMISQNIRLAWQSVMDEAKNPLSSYPLSTAHMIMQLLAWMWSVVFSISIGSYVVFGITAAAHLAILGALFMTLAVFEKAQSKTTANVE